MCACVVYCRNVRVAVLGAPTTRIDRTVRELQRRGSQPMFDPMRHMPGGFPVHVASGTAHRAAAHRAAGARPWRRRRWRETVPVRPVWTELPLPFGLSQAPRTKPPGPFAGRQAVHVRHMRHAVQVSPVGHVYYMTMSSPPHAARAVTPDLWPAFGCCPCSPCCRQPVFLRRPKSHCDLFCAKSLFVP